MLNLQKWSEKQIIMAIMRIYKYGEQILRRKMKPVDLTQIRSLRSIIDDMFETMDNAQGVGLAANQVGLDMRLAVISIPIGKDGDFQDVVLINPVIVQKEGEMHEEEGCLSFPGIYAKVKRFQKITVHTFNERGIPVEIKAEGLLAKAIQHEMDHLDGICFVDKVSPIAKIRMKGQLAKIMSATDKEKAKRK